MDWKDRLFLLFVAVLPLHTVFLSAWVSWKPFIVVLGVLTVLDAADGFRERRWPWNGRLSAAAAGLGLVVLAGWPQPEFLERYLRLGLALTVGVLVLLVTERRLRDDQTLTDRTLRVVFWTGAAMASTAFVLELVVVGAFGEAVIGQINDIPGVFRFFKPAYLESGFLALTNWHQDPGYAAAWMVLWATLAWFAVFRGVGSARWWLDGVVVGGLWFGVLMAFSRTGWLSLLVATVLTLGALVGRWKVPAAEVGKRAVAALATVVLAVSITGVLDRPGVGGDLDVQFAFRLSQGWDLLADLTGLFDTTEAFADRFEVSEQRADVWPEYWRMFLSHPVLGVGLGVGWLSNSIGQEPHNLFLELLAETGLAGLAAFLVLLAAVVRSGRGVPGATALFVAFLPALTQTVLFEPTWWFAAALYAAGSPAAGRVTNRLEARLPS